MTTNIMLVIHTRFSSLPRQSIFVVGMVGMYGRLSDLVAFMNMVRKLKRLCLTYCTHSDKIHVAVDLYTSR